MRSDGEVVGLVTATDAFEAVMGEPEDPLDEGSDADRTERGQPRGGAA